MFYSEIVFFELCSVIVSIREICKWHGYLVKIKKNAVNFNQSICLLKIPTNRFIFIQVEFFTLSITRLVDKNITY